MVSQANRKTRTIKAILTAARVEFGSSGYKNSSIDKIASKANVTKGAIYHHFVSKEKLFEAVLFEVTNSLSATVAETLVKYPPSPDLARKALEVFFEAAKEDGVIQICIVDAGSVVGLTKWRKIDSEHFGKQIRLVLSVASQNEGIDETSIEVFANIFSAAINEALLQCSNAKNYDQTSARYIDGIISLYDAIV